MSAADVDFVDVLVGVRLRLRVRAEPRERSDAALSIARKIARTFRTSVASMPDVEQVLDDAEVLA
jgi:hypothetical protein